MAKQPRDTPARRRERPQHPAKRRPGDRGAPGGSAARDDGPRRRPSEAPRPLGEVAQLWGLHAVSEALRSPRRTLLRLLTTEAATERIAALALARAITPEVVPAGAIAERVPRDAVHQGLLLETRPLVPVELDEIADEGLVLVLDQVTDPHNVGAILRTAAAFGVAALVMTDRHAPPISGTLAKAASGGLEHVPIALVVNLARALDELGDRGFLRIGLDSEADGDVGGVAAPGPVALVLGAEGVGLRRLTRERCDVMARLDLPGPIRSLNVSNACAAALTALRMRRGAAQ